METTLSAPSRLGDSALNSGRAPAGRPIPRQKEYPITKQLDVTKWASLPEEVRDALTWFHQHCLNEKLSMRQAGKCLNYDKSVISRILDGEYEGSWEAILAAITSYRKIWENRSQIQNSEFTPNRNTKLIWNALDYALHSNTIVIILGETGLSKSITKDAWMAENNHGRTVGINAMEICTVSGLIHELSAACGVKRHIPQIQARGLIHKSFNSSRMLCVDEAHFLLTWRRSATAIEFLRRLHDETRAGVALIASARFGSQLEQMEYHFEQLLGRCMIVRLFNQLDESDILPLLQQYFAPGALCASVVEIALAIANDRPFLKDFPRVRGRIRALVEILRFATKIARKQRTLPKDARAFLTEQDLLATLQIRKQLAGQQTKTS